MVHVPLIALWNDEEPIRRLGIEVPKWIDQDIAPSTLLAVIHGGCESGAYMPAVTYYTAMLTMNKYGEEVMEYVRENHLGPVILDMSTWQTMATSLLSAGVETWCLRTLPLILEKLRDSP